MPQPKGCNTSPSASEGSTRLPSLALSANVAGRRQQADCAQAARLVATHKSGGAQLIGAFTPLPAAGGVRPGVYAGFAVFDHLEFAVFSLSRPFTGVRPVGLAGGP